MHEDKNLPGFIWIKLVTALVVWLGFLAVLLWVWRIPEVDVRAATLKLVNGFSIGSVEIVPSKIFESILVLILLLTLNSWFQRVLDRSWLKAARIDRGARESILTISN